MMKDAHFLVIGTPLVSASILASFFPTDTFFCIERDTFSGYCQAEMGTGLLIRVGAAYLLAAGIHTVFSEKNKEKNKAIPQSLLHETGG